MTSILKSFEVEFQPFIKEINAKEEAIRECADAATMARIKGMLFPSLFSLSFFHHVSLPLRQREEYDSTDCVGSIVQNLTKVYRN